MVKYSIILHANDNVFSWEMADELLSYILIMLTVYCSMQSTFRSLCVFLVERLCFHGYIHNGMWKKIKMKPHMLFSFCNCHSRPERKRLLTYGDFQFCQRQEC